VVWPLDAEANLIHINLAVGDEWPGSPNDDAPFPGRMLVDYAPIYAD
jgi:hypothetical protein